MDASDEFRFISGSTPSSVHRQRRNESGGSENAGHAAALTTNSLRSVPVCVYNENRSFKLRFFWDKAFKLFHSHRPVYRAVSGINYQDCGTIGSCNTATLPETSPFGSSSGTGLVKVRSQSHNQLNRIPGGEVDHFRNKHSRRLMPVPSSSSSTSRIVTTLTSSGSASRNSSNCIMNEHNSSYRNGGSDNASLPLSSGATVLVPSEELEFIPVVVPRKKNRAFGFSNSGNGSGGDGFSSSGCGNANDSAGFATTAPDSVSRSTMNECSSSTVSTSTKYSHGKKKYQRGSGSAQSFRLTRPVSSSISGGEKPQGDGIPNGNNDDDDESLYYYHHHHHNNNHGNHNSYDNIHGSIHVNNNHSKRGSSIERRSECNNGSSGNTSKSRTGTFAVNNNAATGTNIVFPHSTKNVVTRAAQNNSHVIVPSSHHHHSTVSATLSSVPSSSSTNAPVQLRRTQSTKSHHSSNESQQQRNSNSISSSRSANRSSEKGLFAVPRNHIPRNAPSPTCSAYESWKSIAGSSKRFDIEDGVISSNGCGCTGAGGGGGCCALGSRCPCHFYPGATDKDGCCNYCSCQEDSVHREDSDTVGNDSGLDTWKKSSSATTTANESPKSGSCRSSSDDVMNKGSGGVEETSIVCTIAQKIPNRPVTTHQHQLNNNSDEDDYATVASEDEEEEQGRAVVVGNRGETNVDDMMMIENGSVMFDSLDDTYSVPPVSSNGNGNTTVVLINGCCESDHCQNVTLSDTFNFSDYDVECMSEIDLNSEPGTGSGSSTLLEPINGSHHHSGQSAVESQNKSSSNDLDEKYIICHSTSENELDSLDLAMFETKRAAAAAISSLEPPSINIPSVVVSEDGETCIKLFNGTSLFSKNNSNNHNNLEENSADDEDRNSSLCVEAGGVVVSTTPGISGTEGEVGAQILLFSQKYGTNNSTTSAGSSIPSTMTSAANNKTGDRSEEIYSNWSDAGSEFEFLGPSSTLVAAAAGLNRDIPMGHSPRGNPPDVEWEPYFCVLNQLDQTFTSYRSEEMSIFPGTPTRPRTQTNVFGENGISPTEIPRVRLDGGPNSIKCLINNAKWGMNPLMEEEEENNTTGMASSASHNGNGSNERDKTSGDYSSSSGSSSNQRTSSSPTSPLDTSYDKACGSERRGSAPLTPLLGRETPSRFANFFSKRSFKSNPLKRTKSVTKLERKKAGGVVEPESNGNILYPSRMRISRSHESLLAWTNNPVNSFVSNGMMSTMDLTAGDVSIRPLHPSILGQEYAFQVTAPAGSKYYTCSSAAERDSWVYAFRQAIRPRADEVRRRENALKIWVLEGKGIPGGSSGKNSSKRYFCELYLDDVLYARTCAKPRGEMLFWGEHFEFTQLPNCVQLITVVFFREGDKKRKKERNTCIGKVKIPVNSVTSRYLIEKWYPVLPESSSHSSKEKEHPSLRVKCKYQSVDILPLRCYKSFLQYVKDQYGPLSESLESVLSVKAKEDLASAMGHVLHHEGLAKEFIAELALQEILKSGDEKLTFRGNSIATKAMEAFLKLTGTEYLHATLGPFIEQFQGSEDLYDCEIDPMKLPMGANLSKNQQNLRIAVDTVWKAIMHSHSIFPIELRECFSHCRDSLKSAGKEELSDHLISASIFLRFLCPAILSPSLFNITNEYPSEKSARNLTLIAKVLQTLANFTRFQGKENYMEFINDFVEREASNMKAFLSCISSPLNPEAMKKAQKESRDKVPAGGFIDLGKFASILSTLLSENVAKIAPKNDRFKHLQELLETIHKWLDQPANATNVSMFPFPHLPSPPPTGPPPPAPLGIPMNPRFSNPLCNNSQAINHQYQIPHHMANATPTPIYAVSSVIHNNSNPNVKNISQVQMNLNGNCIGPTGNGMPPYPLQLQIPHVNPNQIGINNPRSGSQASSGYQSQSPVLEGDDKANKKSSHIKDQINAHINNINMRATEMQDATTALTFNNPVFNRKVGSQSVDDLSIVGVEKKDDTAYPRRLTRSSSSSDCEYTNSNISPAKGRSRGQAKLYSNNSNVSGQQSIHSKSQNKSGHHRLSRRSSAELLRKNHPYSSSSDEDSDSGLVNERDEPTPHLPPRRNHIKRSSGHRPVPDGSSNGEKSLEEYEREMLELRRAMEALQAKLSRAEERLFGNESPGQNKRTREGDNLGSPANSGGSGNGSKDRYSRSSDDGCKEMDQLLQRLLSAEEEMKREHDLLTALDKKQKLIEAQEQKIARLDSVNNQLLQALAQIRDSLQQQHVQQQQQKIQQQLLKQQQHLKNLANGFVPACNHTVHQSSLASQNSLNNNGSLGSRPTRPNQLQFAQPPPVMLRDPVKNHNPPSIKHNNNNCNPNTTKVMITSSSSESLSQATGDSHSDSPPNHRDSSAILGEQALQMLAELRSSSC